MQVSTPWVVQKGMQINQPGTVRRTLLLPHSLTLPNIGLGRASIGGYCYLLCLKLTTIKANLSISSTTACPQQSWAEIERFNPRLNKSKRNLSVPGKLPPTALWLRPEWDPDYSVSPFRPSYGTGQAGAIHRREDGDM